MAQQISLESALEVYRKQAGELFHRSLLLEARVSDLEAEVERLRDGADEGEPAADSDSNAGG